MRSEHVNFLFDSIKMSINAIDLAMRGSGRTAKLFEDYREGDLIVCTPQEMPDYRHRLRAKQMNDSVVLALRPTEIRKLRQSLAGRRAYVHFSHEFIRQSLLEVIDRAGSDFCDGLRSFQETQRREPALAENLADQSFIPDERHSFSRSENVNAPSRRPQPDSFASLGAKTFTES